MPYYDVCSLVAWLWRERGVAGIPGGGVQKDNKTERIK